MGGKRWVLILVVTCSLWGCQRAEDPAELAELQQVKREAAALNASLDELGTRLVVGRQLVANDAELRARHAQVSQIACQNLSDHWSGISRFLDNQREKEHKKRSARVAAAEREQSD